MSRAHALLPPAWRGTSRAAAWRRARGRRVASAGLLLIAGLLGWGALQGRAAASRTIVVAARDLPAGHVMLPGDLRERRWPSGASLAGALPSAAAQGSVTTGVIAAGEPVTASRVRTSRHWPGVRAGDVVVSVPIADPTLTGLLRTGDHIDVLGATGPVGADLPVLLVTAPTSSRTDDTAGAVWVSAPSSVASRIAAETAMSRTAGTQLSVVLRPAA
ncbi:SAF domain-containing protein [Allobranchiibius sp. CTAmp26]|uniref:SAF domain-containing protein n=1 Tax=Allobranchiibius sp. CTAmp26 TaxID=2815214 RepID=UPI001AA117E5|nr:SAF domain-containing protein [Allobranchiibius sp. CTAmp26]MBO1753537.1 hypothetical protein [Allobranchiibius sp. CTAmp26]